MEIIRLGYDNIEELANKLEEAGFDDFSPFTKEERGFKPGIMWWGFGHDSSAFYKVEDKWEFQFNDDGSLNIKHYEE